MVQQQVECVLAGASPHGKSTAAASCHTYLVVYMDEEEEGAWFLLFTFCWVLPAQTVQT